MKKLFLALFCLLILSSFAFADEFHTLDNYIFKLNDNVTRKTVNFKNRFGINLAGDLYFAKDLDISVKHPAIVIGAPYGGVKEQSPGIYAQEMAKNGFVTLTFDASFNGYSSGQPRHLSSPELFTEDFSAGVDFLGTHNFVDREKIGAIGICGSGSFALSAAAMDLRIKAVATISMYDISRVMRKGWLDNSDSKEARDLIRKQVAIQRWAEADGNPPAMTDRGAALEIDSEKNPIESEFGEFYSRKRGYHHNSIAQFTFTSLPAWINFQLLDLVTEITPRPILLIIGENAHSRYFSEDVYKIANEPKELFVVPDANHVDLYDNLEKIPFEKLDSFFKENLK